jgi:hypothetical protein
VSSRQRDHELLIVHCSLCSCGESGGTGRRARLRIWWATVGVQVPPLAPNVQKDCRIKALVAEGFVEVPAPMYLHTVNVL